MRSKKELEDWLDKRVKLFDRDIMLLTSVYPNIYGIRGSWSILKLITLGWSIAVYSPIIKNNFDKMFYVDFFSGSGINSVNKHITHGSPIIATNYTKKPFDFMIFVEENQEYAKALEKRLDLKSHQTGFRWLQENFKVISGDINNKVEKVVEILEEKGLKDSSHCFTFIDPHKNQDLHWKTIELWCRKTNSDLLINILKSEMWRGIRPTKETGSLKYEKWAGNDNWKSIENKDKIVDFYYSRISNLQDPRGKVRTNKVLIPINAREKDKKESYYDLLYMTTPPANWLKAIRELRENISPADDNLIKMLFEKKYSGQRSLNGQF